ncbi:helix-turn-helix domain-containing protein [Amycolatopsis rubida]|uniref:Helix-turn-helix domain-containing protein n=1 Tax=Amycolatopsis rubida TaxID=112413 RepID=A0A1I5X4U9_9PSEU|nr:helix-turn-helix transcriptional regulator [Amycolatopsis rubida]SFQ26980.1 Helix-turn-helix domain-containing protein [Amycolatopsis rubida]
MGEIESFGDVLRRLRVAAGLTQQELARRTHMTQPNVSKIESGGQGVPEEAADRLDKALNADGRLMAVYDPLDTGPLNSDQRNRIAWTVRHPGLMDAAAVDVLAASLAAQRRVDDLIGPEPMLAGAKGQARMMTGLLKQVRGPARPQLSAVTSEYMQFAGWLLAEARHDRLAVEWLTEAGDIARIANDGTLAAQASNFKGFVARQRGRPTSMVKWFVRAFEEPGAHVAQRIGDTIQAAQGYARLHTLSPDSGYRDTALRLLADADDLVDEAGKVPPPATAYWLTPTFHLLNSGLAHLALHDHATAADHFRTGLESLPPNQQNAEWTTEYRLGLAEAEEAR